MKNLALRLIVGLVLTLVGYYALAMTVGIGGALETIVLVLVVIAITDLSFRWLQRGDN